LTDHFSFTLLYEVPVNADLFGLKISVLVLVRVIVIDEMVDF